PHPGQEFGKLERLGEVVVRAAVQTAHLFLQRVPRGKHQDCRVDPAPTEFAAHLHAVAVREHHVEEDHVVLARECQCLPLLTVQCHVYHVTSLAEPLFQDPCQPPLVFHDQELYVSGSCFASGRVTVIVVPWPCSLSVCIASPCASAPQRLI